MGDFFKGMLYVFYGLRLVSTPGLKRFIVIPIVFNIILFIGSCYWIYHFINSYLEDYMSKIPSWLGFLNELIFLFFIALSFFLFISLFTVLFNIVASPFNGLLAEKAQKLLYKSSIPPITFAEMVIRSIKRQGQFLLYFIPRLFILLLLFFVPFIHSIYPFLWFLFTSWILSTQYQDLAMDNNLISFQRMRLIIKERTMLSLGFGCGVNIFSFIPFLNLFTVPIAVIGGVMLFSEEYDLKRLRSIN